MERERAEEYDGGALRCIEAEREREREQESEEHVAREKERLAERTSGRVGWRCVETYRERERARETFPQMERDTVHVHNG